VSRLKQDEEVGQVSGEVERQLLISVEMTVAPSPDVTSRDTCYVLVDGLVTLDERDYVPFPGPQGQSRPDSAPTSHGVKCSK
jgi:hypothetical protein